MSFTQCKIADISKELSTDLPIEASQNKAAKILDKLIETQGFKVLEKQALYSFIATDHWPGFTGKLVKLWPQEFTRFQFKYHFNTFDGQLLFLDGEEEGNKIGVQSWNYYQQKEGEPSPYLMELNKKASKYAFGLSAFQYFSELPYRLRSAPILRYFGTKELRGQVYDLVFASWQSVAANSEFDQYILWVNRQTHLLDYAVYTIRENTNLITRKFHGSIAYLNYTDVGGFKVAKEQAVFVNRAAITTESLEDYFHKINIETFTIGGFKETEIYPFSHIPKKIDSK